MGEAGADVCVCVAAGKQGTKRLLRDGLTARHVCVGTTSQPNAGCCPKGRLLMRLGQ